MGGAGCVGGQEKGWMVGVFPGRHQSFGINADQWMTAAQDEEEWRRTAEQCKGRNISWQNRPLQKKSRLDYGMQRYAPNVTGRTKERIAQGKRARAGSLALVD